MEKRRPFINIILTVILIALSAVFIAPVFIVLLNSFKSKFSISQTPFVLPNNDTFVTFQNYITGINDTGFLSAFGWSLFVTVLSVAVIVVFTSMAAWYIVRSGGRFAKLTYYLFVFSMIVPFQMVMFTMSKLANSLGLDTPLGLVFIYLGFGAGLSVFMFVGFVKSIPLSIEEAATIDGCNPMQIFYHVVFPLRFLF